jgi:hypothetical protein
MSRLARCAGAALCAAVAVGTASAAELTALVQRRIANATFEVVDLKLEADPLTYEKPLPLELIPFRERTDKYRSLGTAFAIGKNRFAVSRCGSPPQCRSPMLTASCS